MQHMNLMSKKKAGDHETYLCIKREAFASADVQVKFSTNFTSTVRPITPGYRTTQCSKRVDLILKQKKNKKQVKQQCTASLVCWMLG